MSDSNITPPRVSNRISPLLIIILVALIAFVAFAFMRMQGHHTTPTGVQAPTDNVTAVMPQQPNVANTPQPAANTNTNDSAEAQPDTDREPGGLASHSGPANSTGR